MKKQILICCAAYLLQAAGALKAQEDAADLKSRYEHETIMLEGNTNHYEKDHERKRTGIFGAAIEKEFAAASAESKEKLHTYRRHKRNGTVLIVAGGAVLVSSLVLAPLIIGPAVFVGSCTGLTTYCIGAFKTERSKRHLHKAVWLRNRDVLARDR